MKEYVLNDLSAGLVESFSVTLTQAAVDAFIGITGDDNPLHTDANYCRALGMPKTVVHGCLTASFISTLVGKYLPGKNSRLLSLTIAWPRPVFIGDELLVKGTVEDVSVAVRTVEIKVRITNQTGQTVASGNVLAEVLK